MNARAAGLLAGLLNSLLATAFALVLLDGAWGTPVIDTEPVSDVGATSSP